MLSSWTALALIAAILLGIVLVDSALFNRHRRRLLTIARAARVQYSPIDRFHLQPRVAASLDDLAAAQIEVRDVMYAGSGQGHAYCFTIQYLTGAVTHLERTRRVALVHEPPGRSVERFTRIDFATPGADLDDQYRELLAKLTAGE